MQGDEHARITQKNSQLGENALEELGERERVE